MNFLSRENLHKLRGDAGWRFAAVLATLFLVIAGIGASHHEFWRDEAQAWLIARDVPTLSALLEQAHYEGAPPLWSLMLRPLALLTPGCPGAMQVLTWALAGAMVFVFVRFAPFSRIHKILILSNYYLLFQYGIVCRNYLPGLLCLTIACVLYPAAKRRPWGFTVALVGAGLASVHSLIVAMALGASFWLRWGWSAWRASEKPGTIDTWRRQGLALGVFVIGIVAAVYAMNPRADTFYAAAADWHLDWDAGRLPNLSWALVNAYFPLPQPPGFFWIPPWDNPDIPSGHARVFLLPALGIVVAGGLLLRRHLGALLFYLFGTLGVVAFFYVKYLGFSRHTGFLFFTFLFALWIKRNDENRAGAPRSLSDFWAGTALSGMLAVQAITGVWAVKTDYTEPFSCGKAAAQMLRDRHLEHAFIAASPDWAGAPISAYLNRTLYYPQRRAYASFTRWDRHREEWVTDEEFLLRAFKEADGREVVLVWDHRPEEALRAAYHLESFPELHGSLTPFEDYYLFRAPAKANGAD